MLRPTHRQPDRERRPRCVAQMVETLQMGGAENLAIRIANAQAARGLDSRLYVLVETGPLIDRVDPRVTVRVFNIRRSPVRRLFAFISSIAGGYHLLRQAIREDGVELIQSHLPGANFWGLLLSLRHAAEVVPTVHNTREFEYGDADHPLRSRLRRMAYRAMLKRCWATVAVSEPSRLALIEALGISEARASRLFAVPNGVAIPDPLPAEERDALRRRHGCGENDLMLLAAGRHGQQKNFRTLIEALALLPPTETPWRLVLAGDGPLREAHMDQAREAGLADSIDFPGVVTDLDRLMQAADLFVLPSLWEGLPLVLLEAMACGLPVAGTRIDGISEVIVDQQTGLLADPGDARQLADILARLIMESGTRRALGDAARILAREEYSLDRVVEDLMSIYTRGDPSRTSNETTVSG